MKINKLRDSAIAALVSAPLILSFSAAAKATDSLSVDPTPAQAFEVEPASVQYVDGHWVLLIDVSYSVDNIEYAAMMRGYRDALLNLKDTHFGDGYVRAISLVFFGNDQRHVVTQGLNDKNIEDFVREYIWDYENDRPYNKSLYRVGTGTNVLGAYFKARDIFKREREIGLESQFKRVIIIGDQCTAPGHVRDERIKMEIEFGVTFHGLPVTDGESSAGGNNMIDPVAACFQNHYVTQEGAKTKVLGFPMPIEKGQNIRVKSHNDLRRPLEIILSLPGF